MRLLVLSAYNVLRLLTWPLALIWWRLRRLTPRWVVLRLHGQLDELPRARRPWQRLFSGLRAPRASVLEVRRLCDRLAADPHAVGLLLRLERLDAGYATLASLRSVLEGLRRAGKQVVCYLPLEASQRELYIASAADRVLAMPHAGLSALGPAASRTYFAPLLERVGVEVLVTAEGRYKTAADPFVRASMSEPEREQLTAIVRVLYDTLESGLGSRPALGRPGAAALFKAGLFGAQRGRELGIIDECAYDDQLSTQLGLAPRERFAAAAKYLARSTARPRPLVRLRPMAKIAVVRLAGAISERRTGASGIDLHGTTAVLRRLHELEEVAGVILYLDSPGGSAIVSELLHREIERLDAKKPVVTWMGNVCASGGYYMASATRAIVARPATLTGSIGVVSIRPVAERVLELLQVRRELVSLTPFADLSALARRPDDAEELLLRGETDRFYQRFLDVVAEGRKRDRSEIVELAQGRVWAGADAHEQGLVDTLGGYEEARAALLDVLGAGVPVAEHPLWLDPARKEAAALPPARGPVEDIKRALAQELAGVDDWLALAALAQSGERVFAYSVGLPTLR